MTVNGQNAGTICMRGQKLNITGFLKTGQNHMEVLVTNTLINRISAMKEPTPVPAELVPRFGASPTLTPGQLPREFGFKPLPASGLMGPVRIIAGKEVKIKD